MGCDYYTKSELIIEFIDEKGAMCKTRTNICQERNWIHSVPDADSDEDQETQSKKYYEELERCIQRNTYKKVLYENETWVKESYEKRYLKELKMICPRMVRLIRMYKDYTAWKRH